MRTRTGLGAITVIAICTVAILSSTDRVSARAEPSPAPPQISVLNRLLEPFSVEIPGGIADSGLTGTSNPRIIIDSDGDSGSFVVTSILLRTEVPSDGFVALSVNELRLNGISYDTRTENLVDFVDGSGVRPSADLMGTPVRTSFRSDAAAKPGGNFPHQITAESAGTNDVNIQFFARSDVSDLEVESVRVSGWKRIGDTVSVTYVPGS